MSDQEHHDTGEHASGSPPPGLGELEHDVMDVVWDADETTVREVLRTLNATSDRERAYTTVMTVMGNLRRKGLLVGRREGRTDVYSPALSREAYLNARARFDVETLVGRYGDVALAYFAREVAGLNETQRRQLRSLLDDE